MKVLDLQCNVGHTFEGWFASEEDFVAQCQKAMVQCPLCGDVEVRKKLSAPRLNLSGSREPQGRDVEVIAEPAAGAQLAAAWLELSRRIVANTDDVGERFAEEARRMHYGETQERAIRGKTSVAEARALVQEGIDILPLALPQALKETLQ